MNICLLGDSILDNRAYTRGQPSVVDHLNQILGDGQQATLLAVDGSITAVYLICAASVPRRQITQILLSPPDPGAGKLQRQLQK